MANVITNELAISILENEVKNYELVIEKWIDAPLEIKNRLYDEKKKAEDRLLELYAEKMQS